jgi:hypothetical protein
MRKERKSRRQVKICGLDKVRREKRREREK